MSYWTYTDLFEEAGPPPAPFHGGFGLLTREGIRKPAYFAYKYMHALSGKTVPSSDMQSFISTDATRTAALIWAWSYPAQTVSNRSFYTKVQPTTDAAPVELAFSSLMPGRYALATRRTGSRRNDAYTAYLEMGAPTQLSEQQLERLNEITADQPETQREETIGDDGKLTIRVPMRNNDVVLVTLTANSPGR
jgi:xylan 1,4-beta-xylosidase